jgi:hypothetical protein
VKRLVLAVIAIFCLLAGAASASIWTRSYFHTDRVQWQSTGAWQAVLSGHGRGLYIYAANGNFTAPFNGLPAHDSKAPVSDIVTDQWLVPYPRQFLGFAYGTGSGSGYTFGYIVVIPYWFTTFVPWMVTAWWIRKLWQSRHAVAAGCCRVCGYDLRATPDRCPECGTVPKTASPEVRPA